MKRPNLALHLQHLQIDFFTDPQPNEVLGAPGHVLMMHKSRDVVLQLSYANASTGSHLSLSTIGSPCNRCTVNEYDDFVDHDLGILFGIPT